MKTTTMIEQAPVNDPVIEAKRRQVQRLEDAARMFKRIDIKFLTVVRKNEDVPAFAILPLDAYQNHEPCEWRGAGVGYWWNHCGDYAFGELTQGMGSKLMAVTGTATPPGPVPDGALAVANEYGSKFDRLCVAWDAEWQQQPGGDPLLIGEIDGVWFLLAKWDTTALESFIAE